MSRSATGEKLPGKKETIDDIARHINAGYPLLYLYTTEELKTLQMLRDVARDVDAALILTFDSSAGLDVFSMNVPHGSTEAMSIEKIRRQLTTTRRDTIDKATCYILDNIVGLKTLVVFRDMHTLFQEDPRRVRIFKNLLNRINDGDTTQPITLFILSAVMHIPTELRLETQVIDIPLPTRDEVEAITREFLDTYGISISDMLRDQLVEALNGLSESEIRYLVNYCCVDDGKLDDTDLETIISNKRQIIKREGILEFVINSDKIEDIGGLETLKKWLLKKKKVFEKLEKARQAGVDMPKGLLLFGMPGCGKSLAAKATASLFEIPLLRLDMGMIMGAYLGQSEENIRKAIKLAEAISPTVLWIDELEKAFAGVSSSGGQNSETSMRVFGTILTWMQDKTKPVFLVATANNIKGMPPEFLRKGRFDEVFFVDFPSHSEAKDIFSKQLGKRIRGDIPKTINLNAIAGHLDGFSGADIEAVIKEVIEDAFINDVETFTTEQFVQKIKEIKPLSKSDPEGLKDLKEKLERYDCKKAN